MYGFAHTYSNIVSAASFAKHIRSQKYFLSLKFRYERYTGMMFTLTDYEFEALS